MDKIKKYKGKVNLCKTHIHKNYNLSMFCMKIRFAKNPIHFIIYVWL